MSFQQRLASLLFGVQAIAGTIGIATAQHVDDNPVISAGDAFGLRLGTESIGIYSAESVRGFSPQAAGNVRIDGLYFDQQGVLTDRVVENATVRVGINAIADVFPAPTGIVDFELRNAGSSRPQATATINAGPFKTRSFIADGSVPLAGGVLQLPMGASYEISAQTLGGPYPGYSSRVTNFGAAPQWTPNDHVTVRAFFDWQKISHEQTMPIVLTQGNFLPPQIAHRYLGQDWAEGESSSENFGATVHAALSEHWSLAAGMFHSIAQSPVSFADIYVDATQSGLAEHVLVGNPKQQSDSTSGEARLTGRYLHGRSSHELVFLVRGRDADARYGGSDTVDAGLAFIDAGLQVEKPDFEFSERVHDHNRLISAGIAYRGNWRNVAELSMGVQRETYEKSVTSPDEPTFHLTDSPWRYYGTLAVSLTESAAFYMGYTQGLEDSGIAPDNAANRGAILPASRTWQVDAGMRYKLTEKIQLVAGVFEIRKPYFNLDTNNVDRELGQQRARNAEISLSGEVLPNLNLIAGALIGRVEVEGPNLAAQGVGRLAFGQPRIWAVFDANYKLPAWPALSIDAGMTHFGRAPASVDNGVYAPSLTQASCGARYKFKIVGKQAALRVQVTNITNVHAWNIGGSPGYFQWIPRSYIGYLMVDL
jgi:iron complex outermembrane recepter protein